ncbi:peptidylprolyl isomerase [Actibacterium sp. XHP0104]|uniref:peptidylprolyl isomerase n=1 Tax=Actibacterium sp. XHP0104 TaxID=2984335 RepID=UPI0021E874C0|nr:peptidylprolyl isomerase [Actibacterium sp. XHP0104]MCV2881563.1 peptidylprolyl isomerase [Actibacterium sp. XHP0104]
MTTALFPDLVVNGETVPQAVVAAEAQNHSAPAGKPGIAWRKAANAVAIRTLLLQEARRRGMAPDPVEVGPGRFETDEEALIRGLLDTAVEVAQPSEADIRAEWARDPERFRAPPLWEVSHILCACNLADEQAATLARARAEALIKQVRDNPRRFADLAKQNSDCGSGAAGGTLGQLGPGDTVPEFEAALRDMAEGDISAAPVPTRHGYHVIRMDAVAHGAVLPFEAVRTKIGEAMEKAAWARAARDFTDALVRGAEIIGADPATAPEPGGMR